MILEKLGRLGADKTAWGQIESEAALEGDIWVSAWREQARYSELGINEVASTRTVVMMTEKRD